MSQKIVLNDIRDLIRDGFLEKAFIEAKNFKKWDCNSAQKLLINLQLLVYENVNKSKEMKATPKDVYMLADFFCCIISENFTNVTLNEFLQCIFHLIKFLLMMNSIEYAKKLFEYALQMKEKERVEWSDTANQLMSKIIGLFSRAFSKIKIEKLDVESRAKYLVNHWKFLFRARKCLLQFEIKELVLLLMEWTLSFHLLNKRVTRDIHLECIRHFVLNVGDEYDNIADTNESFVNLIKLFKSCIWFAVSSSEFEEIRAVYDCTVIIKNLARSTEQFQTLLFCEKFSKFLTMSLCENSEVNSSAVDIFDDSYSLLAYSIEKHESLRDCSNIIKKLFDAQSNSLHEEVIHICINVFGSSLELVNRCFALMDIPYDLVFDFVFAIFRCKRSIGVTLELKSNDLLKQLKALGRILQVIWSLIINSTKMEKLPNILQDMCHYTEESFTLAVDVLSEFSNSFTSKFEEVSMLMCLCIKVVKKYLFEDMYQISKDLITHLLKFLIKLNTDYVKSLNEQVPLTSCLQIYCLSCLKQEQLKPALAAIISWSYFYPFLSEKAFELWGNVKQAWSSDKGGEILSLTVMDMLKEETPLWKEWGVDVSEIKNSDLCSMLMLEIKAYHNKKKLQEYMMNAWLALTSLKPHASIAAKGIFYGLETLNKKFNKHMIKFNKHLVVVLNYYKKKVESKFEVEEYCIYGNLLHCQAKLDIFSERTKMENVLLTKKEKTVRFVRDANGMVVDQATENFETNISDSALAFNKQTNILQKLDTAINYIKRGLIGDTVADTVDDEIRSISLKNIKYTAQLYGLYIENEKAIETWKLLYSLSKNTSSDLLVDSVSYMLGMEHPVDEDLIESVLPVADTLNLNSSTKQLFFIRLAGYRLRSAKIDECIKILENIDINPKSSYHIQIIYLKTIGMCMTFPNVEKLSKFKQQTATEALQRARNNLYYYQKSEEWYSEHNDMNVTTLELAATICQFFICLDMPRSAYMYIKDEMDLVVKLMLPLWSCKLLVLLAWNNITILKLDECEDVIYRILAILGIASIKNVKYSQNQNAVKESKVEQGYSDLLELQFSPLSVTSPKSPVAIFGSPNLHRGEVPLPHHLDCACKVCSNPDAMAVILDVMLFRAVAFSIKKKYSKAIMEFENVLKNMNLFRKVGSSDWSSGRKAMLFFHCSNMHFATGNLKKAICCIKKAIELIKSGAANMHTIGISVEDMHCQAIKLELQLELFDQKNDEECKKFAVASVNKCHLNTRTPLQSRTSPLNSMLFLSPSFNITERKKLFNEPPMLVGPARRIILDDEDEDNCQEENNIRRPILDRKLDADSFLPSIVSSIPRVNRVSRNKTTSKTTVNKRNTKQSNSQKTSKEAPKETSSCRKLRRQVKNEGF